jgi:hypothetical protein
VSFQRGIDGSEPLRPEQIGPQEERRVVRRSSVLAVGTLACPSCDAPVSPGDGPVGPADQLACPYCGRSGAVREFLTLGAPSRPAHVVVRVVDRARLRISSR